MKRLLAVPLFLLILMASECVSAQRTTRRNLKPKAESISVAVYDTVFTDVDSAKFVFSGYEKTLRSNKESFYVTNNSDSVICGLEVAIEYLDIHGRQLDRRLVSIKREMSPSETCRIDLRSWDKQNVMYYYRSPKPRVAQATPYKVRVALIAALKDK